MKRLTTKEREIMELYWEHGPMFVKELLYFPLITEKEYGRSSLTGIIKDYFNDSYMSAVSAFVKEEKISVEELRELIDKIESQEAL